MQPRRKIRGARTRIAGAKLGNTYEMRIWMQSRCAATKCSVLTLADVPRLVQDRFDGPRSLRRPTRTARRALRRRRRRGAATSLPKYGVATVWRAQTYLGAGRSRRGGVAGRVRQHLA